MKEPNLKQVQHEWHGTYNAYAIGFAGSLLLTCISFFLVYMQILAPTTLIYVIVALALVQAYVQLRFFLHVGQEPPPRWETVVFYFMVMILLIIAVGSLWIMYDLNERVMKMPNMEHTHD